MSTWKKNETQAQKLPNRPKKKKRRKHGGHAEELDDLIEKLELNMSSYTNFTVPCGANKCFYKSKDNPTHIGWLIASEKHPSQKNKINQGWKLCQTLEAEFQIKHFLLERPWHCKGCLTQGRRDKIQLKNFTGPLKNNVVIQKVRVAPETLKGIRLYKDRNVIGARQWLELYNLDNDKNNNITNQTVMIFNVSVGGNVTELATPIRNITEMNRTSAFLHHLGDELMVCQKILERYPHYAYDFQILIDERNGDVYHYDFDRVYEKILTTQDKISKNNLVITKLSLFVERVHNLTAIALRHEEDEQRGG